MDVGTAAALKGVPVQLAAAYVVTKMVVPPAEAVRRVYPVVVGKHTPRRRTLAVVAEPVPHALSAP